MRSLVFTVVALFAGACGSDTSGPGPSDGPAITPAGGKLVLANGALTIEAPPGAVTKDVEVTAVATAAGGPQDPALVRGAIYSVTASPAVTFAKAVKVTLTYDPSNGPAGVKETQYGVAVATADAWQDIPGAIVDEAANTVTASVTSLGTFAARRAAPTSGCEGPEFRAFDFWLGEWDVNGVHSTITRDASGCTIFELYRAPMTGKSITFLDPATGLWHQTYVTPTGPPLRMSGRFENGRLVMFVRIPNGNLSSRWTWERVDANTVTQKAEATPDNGTTWNLAFLGTYIRR